jgi:hypothetical protein
MRLFLDSRCTFTPKRSASSDCSISRISGLGGLLKFAGTHLLEGNDAGGFGVDIEPVFVDPPRAACDAVEIDVERVMNQ